jgi:hypothetical protein
MRAYPSAARKIYTDLREYCLHPFARSQASQHLSQNGASVSTSLAGFVARFFCLCFAGWQFSARLWLINAFLNKPSADAGMATANALSKPLDADSAVSVDTHGFLNGNVKGFAPQSLYDARSRVVCRALRHCFSLALICSYRS